MSLHKDRAVVLRTWKLGESDRILSLLTKDGGKVRAVAKGVRKSSSKIGGRVEPFSELSVILWKGKGDLQTLSQAETLAANAALHGDLQRLVKASTVVEVVDNIALEEQNSSALFTLCTRALSALNAQDSPAFLAVFFLRLLTLEGFDPQLEVCEVCGGREALVFFEPESGEVRCRMHPGGVEIGRNGVHHLQLARSGHSREVLESGDRHLARDLEVALSAYLERSFGFQLRSIRGSVH